MFVAMPVLESDACILLICLADCRISEVFHQHSSRTVVTKIYCYWWQ